MAGTDGSFLRSAARRLLHRTGGSPTAPASHYGDYAQAGLRLDMTRMALPHGSCDALLLNHVLNCVPDDRPASAEMHRVLRPENATDGLAAGCRRTCGMPAVVPVMVPRR